MPDNFDAMADEADQYADMLAGMAEADAELLSNALANSYDVIVSEALDYVIKFDAVDKLKEPLIRLSNQEQSYLVSGRLRLCRALSADSELRAALAASACTGNDMYCQAWESAAEIVETGNRGEVAKLKSLTRDPDRTIASLAQSLLDFIRSR